MKMTIQEKIDVLTAYQEGKEIEVKHSAWDKWEKCGNPLWNFTSCIYRVKPEIITRKFRLIKNYPLSPPLNTILEFKSEKDFNDGIENVGEGRSTYYITDCEMFPEFWEEIVEEKIYTNEDDLVGRKCIDKTENIIYTIISKNERKLSLKSINECTFQVSYENFNKHYKLC